MAHLVPFTAPLMIERINHHMVCFYRLTTLPLSIIYLGQNVAIKKMSYSGRVNEKFGEIMKEVKLLQRIRNDYVVELIGTFLKEKEYSAWIIMEYCLGSVSDCVEVRVLEQFYFDFLDFCSGSTIYCRYMGLHIGLKYVCFVLSYIRVLHLISD